MRRACGEGDRSYLGRPALRPGFGTERSARTADRSAGVSRGHIVRWAARESWGFKSPRRSDEGRCIRRRGVIPRWPGEQEGMEKSKRARRRKPETAKTDLEPVARRIPEDRVSRAIRNPKGLRRSIGL